MIINKNHDAENRESAGTITELKSNIIKLKPTLIRDYIRTNTY
jgi:hypothetical protein